MWDRIRRLPGRCGKKAWLSATYTRADETKGICILEGELIDQVSQLVRTTIVLRQTSEGNSVARLAGPPSTETLV